MYEKKFKEVLDNLKMNYIFFVLFFHVFITETQLEDPCFTKNLIDDWRRSVANGVTGGLCDNSLQEQWYRVISGAGELMSTICPIGGFRCGTLNPYWLSSSDVIGSLYPDKGNIVNRTACKADYHGMCCADSIDIRIKNCGCYYVYYLKPISSCYSAYCFGDQRPCPDGLTSSNGFTPGCVNSSYVKTLVFLKKTFEVGEFWTGPWEIYFY